MGLVRLLKPQLYVPSVTAISVERLRRLGIDAVLLDADCTLKRYRQAEVRPEVRQWIEDLRAAGIGLCLVSNGRNARIAQFAGRVNLPFVALAWKPFPFGCREAMRRLGSTPGRTAMVGDQVFADVLAGNWAGMVTVLVEPIHPEDEPWFTRLKRPLEKWIIRAAGIRMESPPVG